jgi:hypothetical protein
MQIRRTCKEGDACTCIIGQFEQLGVMTALKRLEGMGVTDLRMQCGDYQARIGFLMNGQDQKQPDVILLASEIERRPAIFPDVLLFPELFPSSVDPNFSMRRP